MVPITSFSIKTHGSDWYPLWLNVRTVIWVCDSESGKGGDTSTVTVNVGYYPFSSKGQNCSILWTEQCSPQIPMFQCPHDNIWRWGVHEMGALMIGLVPFQEETPESMRSLSAMWRHSKKSASCKWPSVELNHAGTLISDFQPPELWENTLLLFKHAVYGMLLPVNTLNILQQTSVSPHQRTLALHILNFSWKPKTTVTITSAAATNSNSWHRLLSLH